MKFLDAMIIKEIPEDKVIAVETCLKTVRTILMLNCNEVNFNFAQFEDGYMVFGTEKELNSAKAIFNMTFGMVIGETENPR